MSPDWQLRLNRTNQELHSWANGVWQNKNDLPPLPPPISLFLTVDRPLGINFSSPQPSAAIKIKDGDHNIRYEII